MNIVVVNSNKEIYIYFLSLLFNQALSKQQKSPSGGGLPSLGHAVSRFSVVTVRERIRHTEFSM